MIHKHENSVGKAISRRYFAASLIAPFLVAPQVVRAQGNFPESARPIRIVVGLAAGGSLDAQARTVARRLAAITGAQVIVENRPGASMMLSASEIMRAQPDGYALLYAPSSLFAQNPHTLLNVPYDPFKDFTPITMAAKGPLILTAHQSLDVRSAKELITWAKTHPGQLNFASFGTGTSSHIYAVAFAQSAGIEVTHVPYKGTAEATRDLLEGRVQAYFDAAPTAIQNAQGGRVRMIGVAAPYRAPATPDVPTLTEQGIAGLDLTSWIAFVGPPRMAPERVAKLNAMLAQTLEAPDVKDFYLRGAWEAASSTPEALKREMRVAYERWGRMIKQIGLKKS